MTTKTHPMLPPLLDACGGDALLLDGVRIALDEAASVIDREAVWIGSGSAPHMVVAQIRRGIARVWVGRSPRCRQPGRPTLTGLYRGERRETDYRRLDGQGVIAIPAEAVQELCAAMSEVVRQRRVRLTTDWVGQYGCKF